MLDKVIGKKVLFVISDLNSGGAQKVFTNLVNNYETESTKTLITFSKTKSFFNVNHNIEVINEVSKQRSENLVKKIFINCKRIFFIRRFLKENNVDTVVSFMSETNIICIIASLFLKLNIVVSERNNPYKQNKKIVWKLLRFLTYYQSDFIIVNNRFALKFFKKNYSNKTKLISNSIDFKKRLVQKKKKKNILAVSRLHEQKAIDTLFKAFEKLKKSYPDWRLTLVGKGSQKQELTDLSLKLGINKDIDWINQEKNIDNLYKTSSIFCLPSRYEGFPNVILEALSHNLKCIVSNACFEKDDPILKFLISFNVDEASDLCNKIKRTIENKTHLPSARQYLIKNHSSKEVIKKWTAII